VSGHRDGAVLDRIVWDLLAQLGVDAELVPGAQGPARYAAVAGNEAVPSGVIERRLNPRRRPGVELLWRDEETSPPLSGLISLAAACVRRPSVPRAVAAAACAACPIHG
jgi:hypothetical protein